MSIARSLMVGLLGASLLCGCGGGGSPRGGSPRTGAVAIGAGLHGQRGLTASVYAHGPVDVAGLAFDPRGRLWAAAAGLNEHQHDGVYVIARPGATARRVISGLDDPIGLLWIHGTLYVASVGRVTAFSGFDGKSFSHSRVVVRGPARNGENNALVQAPDGRLVMGVTATCDHCHPASKWSGSIVSFSPDGSDLRLYASRIRAPVGLAFVPGTSDLLVSTNQRNDLGARTTGDALALVRPGSDWRFPECYQQGGAACHGVPAPIAVLDKHAAVGTVEIVLGKTAPGPGLSALVAEWQTGKVARVALRRRASTYAGSAATWLTGIANPLAMTAAPGGSVLVADWSSGTIFRVARRGAR